jgi:hypothetical protein
MPQVGFEHTIPAFERAKTVHALDSAVTVISLCNNHPSPNYTAVFFWWGGTKSTRYCGHFWPTVQAPDDRWGWLWSNWWTEDWQGKPKYLEKTCPSATLSTTNPTWPDSGSNSGRRGGKPATNRLSYGATRQLSDRLNYCFHKPGNKVKHIDLS